MAGDYEFLYNMYGISGASGMFRQFVSFLIIVIIHRQALLSLVCNYVR